MATNNLPVVTVAQFSEIVKLQLSEKNYRPIFGLGKGGIGKTESIETLARRMNIGYIDIRLLLYAETDLRVFHILTKVILLQFGFRTISFQEQTEMEILVFSFLTRLHLSSAALEQQLISFSTSGD